MASNLEINKRMALYDTQYALKKSVPIKETVKDKYVYQPTSYRAVEQNPAAGTLVAPGTKVIVYFEDIYVMPIDIYEGAHVGYAGMKASEVIDKVKTNDAVKKIIEKTEKSVDLTPEEKTIMGTFFVEDLGLEINESDSTRNNKAAYDVIVAAYGLMK